ncbi:SurA N-terminal domain-containing protein [Emcibacter sp.]|uniref:SurA N-terminal domain-containing protein n=1 Tax=Emcibacter sp. TaxID=1979954 RepID=UPI002AA67E5C|nr:SurA N-terminal domain-containing protein [Emcibacter sp.]
MLNFFRSGLSSFFTLALLGVLVASFALWGIGRDVFVKGGNNVAVIGEDKVTAQDFARQFQARLYREQQNYNGELTQELAIRMGLANQVLQTQVNQKAFYEAGRQVGIRISDERLRDYIISQTTFQNDLGIFDRFTFERIAQSQGFTSKQFEEVLREDLVRQDFVTSLVSNIQVPRAALETIYKFERESRTADVVTIRATDITGIPAADDETLKAYYEAHSSRYMAPEYRSLSYIIISPDQFTDAIQLDEQDVLDLYEERKDTYTIPEKRTLQQLILNSREEADAAVADLKAGMNFLDVVEKHSDQTLEDSNIGNQSPADLEDVYGEAAAAAVFSLAGEGVTEPVETDFGWYIFNVIAIEAGSARSFVEVRPELEKELKHQKAMDHVYDMTNKVEDELAGGARLQEISDNLGLELKTSALTDRNGFSPDGKMAEGLPGVPSLLSRAFEIDPSDDPTLDEAGEDSFYAVAVNDIVDEHLRPFDEVSQAVRTSWTYDEKLNKAEAMANSIVEQSGEGKLLAVLAKEIEGATINTVTVSRDDRTGKVSAQVMEAIFTAKTGEITSSRAADQNGFVLLQIKSKTMPETVPENVPELQGAMSRVYQNEILSAYRNYLTEALPVQVNDRVVKAVLDQMSSAGE